MQNSFLDQLMQIFIIKLIQLLQVLVKATFHKLNFLRGFQKLLFHLMHVNPKSILKNYYLIVSKL